MIFWQILDRGCETGWQRGVALLLALAIGAGFYLYGYRVLGHAFLDKYSPVWTLYETIKAAGLMLASWLVFSALRPTDGQLRDAGWTELPTGWLPASAFVLVASALSVIFWPDILSEQKGELKSLSILSEVLLLATIALLALSAWCVSASDRQGFFGLRPAWLIAVIMLVVFLILMEEMSWGQHWLDLTTPAFFQNNLQNEINFHNYHTHPFETAYYSSAALVFVVLPFVWPRRVPRIAAGLTPFIPPPAFAILALPLCGLFYQTWHYVTNQILLYLALLIAVHLFRRESDRAARWTIFVMASLLVISQVLFLDHGHLLPHGHEMTEVREVAIPLTLVAYGILLFLRFRRDGVHGTDKLPAD